MSNCEYIYIKKMNGAVVKIGSTTDWTTRYKPQPDQLTEEFEDNEYLAVFECNIGTMFQIEADFRKQFKENNVEREIYSNTPILLEKYIKWLSKHKDIISQIPDDELQKFNNKNKNVKVVIKEKQGYKGRDLKNDHISHHNIMTKSRRIAQSIQKDNNTSKYTDHDEYFTRYEDIEAIMKTFAGQFKGKVVFCNCDDPLPEDETKCSAFALYFKNNFKKLGLKKLICLHFGGFTDIFNIGETIGLIYTFDGKPPVKIKREAGFDGSFYDQKSIDILNNEADIVCTNHPWSLTQKFYKVLFDSGKKFLVISNKNIVMLPSFFSAIKTHKIKAVKCIDDFLIGKNRAPARASGIWATNLQYKRDKYNLLMPLNEIPRDKIEIDDNGILNFNDGYVPNDYDKEFAVSNSPIVNGILEFGFEAVKPYIPKVNKKNKFRRLLIKKSK